MRPVLPGLVVRDLVELAELPQAGEPRRLRLEICRRTSRDAHRLEGLGKRHPGVDVVVDEEAPDVLVRVLADQRLDVHAAVTERATLAIGLHDLGLDRHDPLEAGLEVVVVHA